MEPRSRTNRVASFSWSLQARARRLTRRGKASANPEDAFGVAPVNGGSTLRHQRPWSPTAAHGRRSRSCGTWLPPACEAAAYADDRAVRRAVAVSAASPRPSRSAHSGWGSTGLHRVQRDPLMSRGRRYGCYRRIRLDYRPVHHGEHRAHYLEELQPRRDGDRWRIRRQRSEQRHPD